VLAWFICREVVGAGWGPAHNPLVFDPYLWARVDSINYLAIAQHGRTFGLCGTSGFPVSAQYSGFHQVWCGLAGWLPGFPWLIRVLGALGISLPDGGLIISWVAMAGALFLVWLGWGRRLHPGRALVVLVLFGLFPGAVYDFAYFPTSLALACVTGSVVAATRGRFLTGAVLMTLGGLCYPSAWFAAAGLAVGLVVVGLSQGGAVVVRRALWGLAGLASLVVLGVHDQIAFGHYNAFFLMDDTPALRTKGFPGEDFLRLVFSRHTSEQQAIGRFGGAVLAVQGVLTVGLVAAAAGTCVRAWRRHRLDALELYPALVGVGVVVGVLVDSATGGAWNRSVVLAAPCVVCLRRLPLPVLGAVLVVVGTTTALISHYFFSGTLI
jgi:hypothetical protein